MRRLLVATRNDGKIPGMKAALAGLPFELVTLNETAVPADYEVAEPGNTYEAHAALKAVLYGKRAGLLTVADDSGLEVDSLGGWPGVHAADWMPGTAQDRLDGLLEKMRDIPEAERTARYRSVIAIFDPETELLRFAEGVCEGRILCAPEGANGFGYDPIFYSDDLGMSFGMSELEQRVPVSHRGRALAKAREILLNEFV